MYEIKLSNNNCYVLKLKGFFFSLGALRNNLGGGSVELAF